MGLTFHMHTTSRDDAIEQFMFFEGLCRPHALMLMQDPKSLDTTNRFEVLEDILAVFDEPRYSYPTGLAATG